MALFRISVNSVRRCGTLLIVTFLAVTFGSLDCAHAQRADDYPSRAVRVIVPFSPGGPPDVIGRPLLQKLSEAFNQPFVFDNRPGASGALGTDLVRSEERRVGKECA